MPHIHVPLLQHALRASWAVRRPIARWPDMLANKAAIPAAEKNVLVFRSGLKMKNVVGKPHARRALLFRLMSFACACLIAAPAWANDIPQSELDALNALYTSTGQPTITYPVCNRSSEVVCDSNDLHVTYINMDGLNLVGTLPSISAFTQLQGFHVNDNYLTGPLPTLTGLSQLIHFHADHNQFTGTIPNIQTLTNLQDFYVGFNNLSGALPTPPASLGSATVCDNPNLTQADSAPWDMAVGNQMGTPDSSVPWYQYDNCGKGSTVTVTPVVQNASFSPSTSQTVAYGATVSFTVTPQLGTTITSLTGCGGKLSGNTFTTGPVTSNCSVAEYDVTGGIIVTPIAGTGGTITPNTPQAVASGGTTSFVVTPNPGYVIASVQGCGGTLSGNTFTTGPITTGCNVAATFETATALIAPTIALAFNPASVAPGGTTTLTATIANPNSDPVQLNSQITITGLPGGVTLSGTSSIACSDGSGAGDPPTVIPANGGTCTLTFANVSAGTTAGSYTAMWGPGVQFVDNNDQTNSVNTTTAATATLTVTSSGGTGANGGSLATAPTLSAWALMLLGMLFAGIGAARRCARG